MRDPKPTQNRCHRPSVTDGDLISTVRACFSQYERPGPLSYGGQGAVSLTGTVTVNGTTQQFNAARRVAGPEETTLIPLKLTSSLSP
jgi:hypothetical protein